MPDLKAVLDSWERQSKRVGAVVDAAWALDHHVTTRSSLNAAVVDLDAFLALRTALDDLKESHA